MMDYQYGNGLSTQKKQGSKINVPHAIVPLTIKQVLGLTKQGQIEHQQFQHVVLIGKLTSCTLQGTKYKISINDGTGQITLTSLTSGQKSKNSLIGQDLSIKKGRYFFVVLTAKQSKQNKDWTYFLDNIREVTNHNQITKHLSDIILSHLERTH